MATNQTIHVKKAHYSQKYTPFVWRQGVQPLTKQLFIVLSYNLYKRQLQSSTMSNNNNRGGRSNAVGQRARQRNRRRIARNVSDGTQSV